MSRTQCPMEIKLLSNNVIVWRSLIFDKRAAYTTCLDRAYVSE